MVAAPPIGRPQLGPSFGSTGARVGPASVITVLLGRTSRLAVGTGMIIGTVIGPVIVGVLTNGLTVTHANSAWSHVATGVLPIVAVASDRRGLTVKRQAV